MAAAGPVEVTIEDVAFFVRNVRVRIPFRYGNACLLGSPILHCRLAVRGTDGGTAAGLSADAFPTRWFDKDPTKPYAQNVEDLLVAVNAAAEAYRDIGKNPHSPFDLWHEAYLRVHVDVAQAGLNALIASFGSSILERALIDAVGKLAGLDYHGLLAQDRLGINPGTIHSELAGRSIADAVGAEPATRVAVRHTLGLADPIFDADIDPDDRVNDGLPESLEGWVARIPFRYFKIKIFGDIDKDGARLERLGKLLESQANRDYRVTLDGNENFKNPEQLAHWLGEVQRRPVLAKLMERIIYIEQPLDRSHALSAGGAASFASYDQLPPVIIDESDDGLDAFKRARELGYRGTSVKSCKGIIKGLLNKMLVDFYNESEEAGCILTGEDLTTIPVVPLQQDLCAMSVLGLSHIERNGHHYYRGLDHVPAPEREECLRHHGNLYEAWNGTAQLRMGDGTLDLISLRVPGLGLGMDLDWESMTPLEKWSFDSLGIEEME